MSVSQSKIGLCVLQWSLGIVILIEAVMFVLPSAAHEFSRTHMPGVVRMILGWGEIAGAVLLLIPKTTVRGACSPTVAALRLTRGRSRTLATMRLRDYEGPLFHGSSRVTISCWGRHVTNW